MIRHRSVEGYASTATATSTVVRVGKASQKRERYREVFFKH